MLGVACLLEGFAASSDRVAIQSARGGSPISNAAFYVAAATVFVIVGIAALRSV